MTSDQLNKEILDITVRLNKALKELEEQGDGFIDKKFIENVSIINKELEEKINIKTNQ